MGLGVGGLGVGGLGVGGLGVGGLGLLRGFLRLGVVFGGRGRLDLFMRVVFRGVLGALAFVAHAFQLAENAALVRPGGI
jgi:hypothetical protein